MKPLKRFKNIMLYSDSEPNELLIGLCHLVCLPLAIHYDFEVKNYFLGVLAMICGSYQIYATLISGCIKKRLFAVQLATLIAIGTFYNLVHQGIFNGSNTGWGLILFFSFWNMIRVFIEKIKRHG